MAVNSPLTVAGAATVFNRIPVSTLAGHLHLRGKLPGLGRVWQAALCDPNPCLEFSALLTRCRPCHQRCMEAPITFTSAGFWRGVRRSLPLVAGLSPFGFVVGLITQHHGLSVAQCMTMNAFVYAGASELVALANWTHPAPILAAAFAALVVNLRFALMGPVLAPWLSGIKTVPRYASLAVLVDHSWAISVTDMRNGGRDFGLYIGISVPLWLGWMVATTAGFLSASTLQLPSNHPLFFGALAAFVALLVPLWRGKNDILPWLVAAGVAVMVAHAVPHTSWYIVSGAISGCITGALLETKRHE